MAKRQHLDEILRDWPYEPHSVCARLVRGGDGRELLQMRVDLGVLQMEPAGRPDGLRPGGKSSYYDLLVNKAYREGDEYVLSEDECNEVDREFVQFYHRRICWLKLQEYRRAVADADHTLGLWHFGLRHSPDDQWTMSHEQYRPFVLFHRTQAAALTELEDGDGVQPAVAEIDLGLDRLREFFEEHGAEEHFDDDELVVRLRELRETLLEQFDDRFKLSRQLEAAVAAEQYELAARIRDALARLERDGR